MNDVKKTREEFPILKNNPQLAYLDTAATSLKPQVVLDAMHGYYTEYTANIKRGIYASSVKATEEYEKVRDAAAKLISASREEIIFTRNTTEGLNLVMYALGTNMIERGDEIVTTVMEHHSNFVPWQQLALQNGATFKIIDVTPEGKLNIFDTHSKGVTLGGIVTRHTKVLAITHVSNVLGTINPIKEIIASARRINPSIIVVVDGAQAAPSLHIDVRELDCDFYAFSGHKMYGPTGVGVLYGKKSHLESMVPFLYGGEMIREVHMDHTVFADLPEKFEAGTPAIGEVIGLGRAIEYISHLDRAHNRQHIESLLTSLTTHMIELFGESLTIVSNKNLHENIGIFTFTLKDIHPHDIASILDEEHVAIRAGHHCAMPLHTYLEQSSSARVSLAPYTSSEDIEAFVRGMQKVRKHFV